MEDKQEGESEQTRRENEGPQHPNSTPFDEEMNTDRLQHPYSQNEEAAPRQTPTQKERWQRIAGFLTRSEWVMVFLTFVIAATGVVGIILVIQGSADSKRLADAADREACASSRFASSAASISTEIRSAETDFSTMAKNSEGAIKATQESMRQDQRAWVGVLASMPKLELKKPITGVAIVTNSGKTFAVNARINSNLLFSPHEIKDSKLLPFNKPNPDQIKSLGLLIPSVRFETRATPLTPEGQPREVTEYDLSVLGNSGWYTYIFGTVTYQDVFNKPHFTNYCWYRTGIEGDFVQCAMHNSAN